MSGTYTIENARPRRTVSLFGRILASKTSGGKPTMDLTLEELVSEPCVRLLRSGRVRLVGEVPPALAALLSSEEPASVVSESEPEAPPALFPFMPEEPVSKEAEAAFTTEVEETPGEDEPSTAEVAVEPLEETIDSARAQLELMSMRELKDLAKERDIKTSGHKDDLINRLLGIEED